MILEGFPLCSGVMHSVSILSKYCNRAESGTGSGLFDEGTLFLSWIMQRSTNEQGIGVQCGPCSG